VNLHQQFLSKPLTSSSRYPVEGGVMFLQNVDTLLPYYSASHFRRYRPVIIYVVRHFTFIYTTISS